MVNSSKKTIQKALKPSKTVQSTVASKTSPPHNAKSTKAASGANGKTPQKTDKAKMKKAAEKGIRQKMTLFVPLSGRIYLWKRFAQFLTEQTWPHDQIRLILMDTSQSRIFSQNVKEWLLASDYEDFRYLQHKVGSPGLADQPRVTEAHAANTKTIRDVEMAMCRIYNPMRNMVDTEFVWVVEDDVIPPVDACERLIQSFCPYTVSVSGVCEDRSHQGKVIAWDENNELLDTDTSVKADVIRVKGNGFGCVLLRTAAMKQHVFTIAPTPYSTFDRAYYEGLDQTQQVKLDWSLRCQHLSPRYFAKKCPYTVSGNIAAENFDETYYLETYEDVAEAVRNGTLPSGFYHYLHYGQNENRWAREKNSHKSDKHSSKGVLV